MPKEKNALYEFVGCFLDAFNLFLYGLFCRRILYKRGGGHKNVDINIESDIEIKRFLYINIAYPY